jgi:hypothetical protein
MTNLHGFELIHSSTVAELNAQATIYRHIKSGAQLLSLSLDDENKVFGVTFRTPPSDSTGLPHILEHCVLGGSQKYPLKEPFVELVKGSLKTFVNAMTYPDKTVYPVASTNLTDFYNLVDVYLDAVFFPLITPHHLDQEGWHYELERADAPLAYKGVVFNEMKGAYSSPDNMLYRYSKATLFPSTTYRYDSGGDPAAIPDLTYAQFKRFHETYYHPSNALFFFYGDDDPQERLRLLDGYLSRFRKREVKARIGLQKPFSRPRRFTFPYGVDASSDNSKKTLIRLNWLLPEEGDQNLEMALSVLSYALIGAASAPLRKALTDSGLGEDVTGGLGSGLRQLTFSAGMKNIRRDDAGKVERLILSELAAIAECGFEPEMVEAAVNTIEFNLRENNTGGYPRGLSVMFAGLGTWLYGGDPLAALRYEGPLAYVKEALAADPNFLSGLIRNHLLDNTHRVTVILEPEPTWNQQRDAAEKDRLAAARQTMDDTQVAAIIDNTARLKERQSAIDPPDLLAKLPSLTLADLEQRNKPIPVEFSTLDGATLLYHDLFTNGIVYLNLGWDIHRVPQHLLPYVKLFGQALVEMGTEKEDYVRLNQRIGRKTGGVWPSSFTSPVRNDSGGAAWFFLSGKATAAQTPELLAIMHDVLATVKLDNPERFRQIVLKTKARSEAGLAPSGHEVVHGRLAATFAPANWATEQMGGLNWLFFLRRLEERIVSDWPGVLADLEATRRALINRGGMVANVTLDAINWQNLQPQIADLLAALPDGAATAIPWQPDPFPPHEGLTIPAQVNYVGKGANLYEVGYEYHGSVNVIANYLRTTWLWDKVRVQGGAYGGMCRFGKQSGLMAFLSYRDPNLLATLDVYDGSADFLRRADLSDLELTRNIIGAISNFDPYQLPDAKGYTSLTRYLMGESDESLQRTRDEILGTTAADFRSFAEVLAAAKERSRVVVMGSSEAISAANQARNDWLAVTRVL